MRSLATFQGSAPTLGHGLFESDVRYFDKHHEALRKACEALGGKPEPVGDISYELPLFEHFPIVVRFWYSDDEFPATLDTLFDGNALQFMHYETLWYAAGYAVKRLTACARDFDESK